MPQNYADCIKKIKNKNFYYDLIWFEQVQWIGKSIILNNYGQGHKHKKIIIYGSKT